jgi:hypothetical protein
MTFLIKVLSIVDQLHRSAAVASQNGPRSSTFFFAGVGT